MIRAQTHRVPMWGLTKQEQRATIFLLVTFGAGCIVMFYRQQLPPPALDAKQTALMDEFIRTVQPPARPAAADTVLPDSVKLAARLNLNTATRAQLLALPGIGPVTAQRIVDYRTQHGRFRSVAELAKVRGIGRKRLAELTPLVTVE